MNYRHAFHAGNVADVLKHIVLARLVTYLAKKPKPFRVIDTHAGTGLYDLGRDEAARSPEWRDGIGRLMATALPQDAARLAEPYLNVVRALNADTGALVHYPGSPLLARRLMRAGDTLSAVELHPADAASLRATFAGDTMVRVHQLDGWLALKSQLPPKERRGLVLVDPPFEARDEYRTLARGFLAAHRRFATGLYVLWYPLKAGAPVKDLIDPLAASGIPRLLRVELQVRDPAATAGLPGCGLILANPPFTLPDELAVLLPALADVLGQGAAAHTFAFMTDPD